MDKSFYCSLNIMYLPVYKGFGFDVYVWAKNLFDKEYVTGSFDMGGGNWVGRGGGTTNTVLWSDDLLREGITNELHSAPYAGGESPWCAMTNTHTWSVSGKANAIYRVKTAK